VLATWRDAYTSSAESQERRQAGTQAPFKSVVRSTLPASVCVAHDWPLGPTFKPAGKPTLSGVSALASTTEEQAVTVTPLERCTTRVVPSSKRSMTKRLKTVP